ncbi:phenazine biosynthesis protein PhzF family [Paenibacillus curdlanolyticus YK9]|uniref:Phenazine biosynthesis protein PhzF family n=1 Tax=Paenibacillus curdlanolyticus YK9 TaxID=717606 RepID=E0IGB7_9BACL|nr:PhzF family phenazine biosynthesis protein [Paenibacillus curdlanolyticus]EFM08519.1 phenazine biosynthesis protein PhzF family [Paenibacillus curdlanolyticus YK9]
MGVQRTGNGNSVPIWIVDAFAEEPFTGNPAAVCIMDGTGDREWMQKVATEMNVSETAFLYASADTAYELRWFTPKAEVDLCGHATLAAAHILWETGRLSPNSKARFDTRSGRLTASLEQAGIRMDFPAEPVSPITPSQELIEALGFIPRYTGQNRMDILVEADSEETVRLIKPDLELLATLGCRGVIVTSRAKSNAAYQVVSRAFYPSIGIDEDPVTGSAHCALGPYWTKRLHTDEIYAYQASQRGGYVKVKPQADRVLLTGQAVTVLAGRLLV